MFSLVVLVFLICNIPFLFGVLWDGYINNGHEFEINSFWYVGNLLMVINSSVNFIIYCLLGKRFRTVFKTQLGLHQIRERTSGFLESILGRLRLNSAGSDLQLSSRSRDSIEAKNYRTYTTALPLAGINSCNIGHM